MTKGKSVKLNIIPDVRFHGSDIAPGMVEARDRAAKRSVKPKKMKAPKKSSRQVHLTS